MKASSVNTIFRYQLAIIFVLLGLIATPNIAQERLPAEELLRFFPMDSYEIVSHEETAKMQGWQENRSFNKGRFMLIRDAFPFPESVLDEAESITHARLMRIYVYEQKPEDKPGRRKLRSTGSASSSIGGVDYGAEGVGEGMTVLRFLDPQTLIKILVDSGELQEMGAGPRDLQLYKRVVRDPKGFDREFYLVALKTGEIISAESVKTLARMLATDAGEEMSILGDPDYECVAEAFDYLGHQLEWRTHTNMFAAIAKYVENKKKNAEPDELDRLITIGKGGGPFQDEATVWDFSGTTFKRDIKFYPDEDAAKAGEKMEASMKNFTKDPYSAAIFSVREIKVDGNKVIATTTYDKDTITKIRAGWEEREKLKAEKKKAQEEKEEGK